MKAPFTATETAQIQSTAAGWFSLILLLLLPIATTAQTKKAISCITDCSCDMAGVVVDQTTGEPLPYATVQVKGTSIGTITDDKGIFHLHNLCTDEFDLLVSYVGYKPLTHHHDLYHEDPTIFLSPDEDQLESVVVEALGPADGMASATTSSISARELEDASNDNLGSLLSRLPGVSTLSTGQNVVKPVVHGLHSSRVLIINNGLRHESQNWGAEHAPEIDPALAGKVSLVKGAATVKYGPGALGGVIIVDPPQPELTTDLSGKAGITLQSNGRAMGATALLQEGYSNLAWLVQAAGLYQGDLHAPDYMLTNTGARELSLAAGTLYHRKRLDLKLHYSYFQQKLGILRGSVVGSLEDLAVALQQEPPALTKEFSYDINTPYQAVAHHLLKLSGTYSFSNSSLSFQYGYQANNRKEFDVRRGADNPIPSINLNLYTHSLDAEWQHPAISIFSGTLGVQAQYQDNNNVAGTNTTPFLPNYNNLSAGIYLAESASFGATVVDLGLRYDLMYASVRGRDNKQDLFKHELRYSSISATAGVLQPLTAWSSIQSNLGLAWRPPNMSELYSFGKHGTSVEYGLWRYFEGQSGLYSEAEKPVNSELSYKWVNTYSYQRRTLGLELTGYLNYIQQYIYTKPAGITPINGSLAPFFIYAQTDALFAGLDASLVVAHNKNWESQLRGMYLYVADLENQERLVGTPPNKLTYSLAYTQEALGPFQNFSTELETSYTFRQYLAPEVITPEELLTGNEGPDGIFINAENGFDFMAAPEGYLLLHLHAGVDKGNFSYRLGIRNLLNTDYRDYTNRLRYFADEPGRNFILSVKYLF